MTSAPHLLNEDRADFEHVLDDALHIVLDGTDTEAGSPPTAEHLNAQHLNAEQLRTMALAATDMIGAQAAAEYEAYRRVRAEIREAAREAARVKESSTFGYAAMGVADGAGSGAGLLAVLAVLTPILSGAAAAIFLLIGYALRALSPEPGIASPLRTAGWFFAAVAAAAIVLGGIGLLVTALRDSSSAVHDTPDSLPPEVTQARELWRQALLDRGLLPFLDDALAAGPAAAAAPSVPAPSSRMPSLGYTRPDFSSPHDAQATSPRFSSPDFSSPDFGGPEHRPE